MKALRSISFYNNPEEIGQEAAISTIAGTYFVRLDGIIVGPYINGVLVGQMISPTIESTEESPAPVSAESPAPEKAE